jgi:hypothetical protein
VQEIGDGGGHGRTLRLGFMLLVLSGRAIRELLQMSRLVLL